MIAMLIEKTGLRLLGRASALLQRPGLLGDGNRARVRGRLIFRPARYGPIADRLQGGLPVGSGIHASGETRFETLRRRSERRYIAVIADRPRALESRKSSGRRAFQRQQPVQGGAQGYESRSGIVVLVDTLRIAGRLPRACRWRARLVVRLLATAAGCSQAKQGACRQGNRDCYHSDADAAGRPSRQSGDRIANHPAEAGW